MAQDFATFRRKVDGFAGELNGAAFQKRLERVAFETKKDVDEAVREDLGDLSMSGWRRGKPIQIRGMYTILTDTSFAITPGKRSRGPMRVLEEGRNRGNSGGFQGPGVNARTGRTLKSNSGKVRVRSRRTKRWNGYTSGKGTWSDSVKLMEERVPERVNRQLVVALKRHFGKG